MQLKTMHSKGSGHARRIGPLKTLARRLKNIMLPSRLKSTTAMSWRSLLAVHGTKAENHHVAEQAEKHHSDESAFTS